MQLSKHSKNNFYKSFALYEVPKEFADPIYNYLVHGFHPGGFFHALLANDFAGAIGRSHPANTITALKALVAWLVNELPTDTAWGSYNAVGHWLKMTEADRRSVLERQHLIFTEQDEIVKILKDEKTEEPFFW